MCCSGYIMLQQVLHIASVSWGTGNGRRRSHKAVQADEQWARSKAMARASNSSRPEIWTQGTRRKLRRISLLILDSIIKQWKTWWGLSPGGWASSMVPMKLARWSGHIRWKLIYGKRAGVLSTKSKRSKHGVKSKATWLLRLWGLLLESGQHNIDNFS
jgi:hypothetical protein